MKKILIYFFISIVVLSVVSIGIGCKQPSVVTETVVETVIETVVETVEVTPEEKIELVYWSNYGPGTERYEWITNGINEYQEMNPNITIRYEPQPSIELQAMMQTLIAAGRGPDVLYHWEGIYLWNIKDYLMDLKEFFTEEQLSEICRPEFLLPKYYLYDTSDKLLGLPALAIGYQFFQYNKAMFEDAGITWEISSENRGRMSWDEFLDACEKLKAAGYTPLGWGNSGGDMGTWYYDNIGFNYYEDNDYLKLVTGEMRWNDLKYVEGLARTNELVQAGYFNEGGLTLGWTEGTNLVANKEVAMQSAFWGYNTEQAIESLGDDYGMMLYPVINEDNPTAYKINASVFSRCLFCCNCKKWLCCVRRYCKEKKI